MTSGIKQPLSAASPIQLTGITVKLEKPLKHSLLIELSIDGTNSRSLHLERKETPEGKRPLDPPLNFHEGSILTIKIHEKHRVFHDQILANTNLTLKDIQLGQDQSSFDNYTKSYPILLKNFKEIISLNFVELSLISPSDSSNAGHSSTVPDNLSHNVERTLNDEGRDAVQQLGDLKEKLANFKTILSGLGKAKALVEKGMALGELVSQLHPIAETAFNCVNIVYKQTKADDECYNNILELVEKMEPTVDLTQQVKEAAELDVLKKTLGKAFPLLMDKTAEFVQHWVEQNVLVRVVTATFNQDEINDLKKRYVDFQQELSNGIQGDLLIKAKSLDDSLKLESLTKDFNPVRPTAVKCNSGTRATILADIGTMINDSNGPNALWIRGAPGTGKSAISLSAKDQFLDQLVTYFRFDRQESAITTPMALWRQVAFDLARKLPSVRTHVVQKLRDPSVQLDSVTAIFDSLIEAPLSKLDDHEVDHSLVIIIDALDECNSSDSSSSRDHRELLQTLGRWSMLPKQFKLIVTSREGSDIAKGLSSIHTPVVIDVPSGQYLTNNPDDHASVEARKDIHAFLTDRFDQLRQDIPALQAEDWPGNKKLTDMIDRAAGNFMWVTTAMDFIRKGIPKVRLDRILADVPPSSGMGGLYHLYSSILKTAFGGDVDDEDEDAEAAVFRIVFGVMICARRSLSDDEYTKLPTQSPMIPITPEILDTIRTRLETVIDTGSRNLRFVHRSFDDFLRSGAKECPRKFAVNVNESHRLLAKLCLTTMSEELRFNICSLETSHLKNVDVPDIEAKVANGISSLLSYSCCFWADHLGCTPFDGKILGDVREMIFAKLLYWFEAMSLLKEVNRISHSLLSVLDWSDSTPDDKFEDILRECKDFLHSAHQFCRAFILPITQSVPHIYLSALPFASEDSLVARHFLPQFPHTLVLSTRRPINRSLSLFTSEHHTEPVHSVIFSSDEKHFLSGSFDGTICFCDSETGNLVSDPFKTSFVFSRIFLDPDGRHVWASWDGGEIASFDISAGVKKREFQASGIIAGCCVDKDQNIVTVSLWPGTVTFWNGDTGERLRDIPVDISSYLVAISPDGRYIASTGRDEPERIRIWKAADGIQISESSHSQPRLGTTQDISTLSFSTDGNFVVTGSDDGILSVWSAKTGGRVRHPLSTGKARVTAVTYSPERNILVAACGDAGTMMVWNASTHEAIVGPLAGHTSEISEITLSRDGQRALTASADGTVMMWDLRRKEVAPAAAHANERHSSRIYSIAISPCGRRLASTDRETIRIWDANSGKSLLGPISGHSRYGYGRILFSPDGNQIVAYDYLGGTVDVWNAETGEFAFGEKVEDVMDNVSFRATDQHLVLLSSRGNMSISTFKNDGLTAVSSLGPVPAGSHEDISVLALSPDGSIALVNDESRQPQYYIWSTTTYQSLSLIITNDDNEHLSNSGVEFSPSGRFLVAVRNTFDPSGSCDGAIFRVWNTQNGELVARLGPFDNLRPHPVTRFAFSPDERCIAFVWRWSAIWILDIHTGCLGPGPWSGHTNSIWTLDFSPDGEKLVSSSEDGELRIWNAADILGHSQMSAGFLGIGTEMKNGWVMDTDEKLLFWVPKDCRAGLIWPGTISVNAGGGTPTELDLSRFKFGKDWSECFAGGK